MAKKNVNAQAMVNTLVDTAFVGDMTAKNEPMTQSEKLHNEAGDTITKKPSRRGISITIAKGHEEKPTNGLHKVRVVDIRPMKGMQGNDDYDLITLRDLSTNGEWKTTISYSKYNDEFNAINYFNHGMLDGLVEYDDDDATDKLLEVLKKKPFMVWTQENEKNRQRVLTYFNRDRYEKYCSYVANLRTQA